jgi:COMPASS component SWD3
VDNIAKYYEILGLKTEASKEEIKQTYRDLVKVWHPDRFSHDPRKSMRLTGTSWII